jgi:hypothetical protein
MRWSQLCAAISSFSLLAACLAPVGDAGTPEDVESAPGALVENSPCTRACRAAAAGLCNWQDQCDPEEWPPLACCAGLFITCEAAEKAYDYQAYGLEWCYRDCENLH